MHLYEIGIEAQQIEWLLSEADGEISPELDARMADFLAGGVEKIENAACVVKSLEAEAATLKQQEARMKKRRDSIEANIERLKALMLVAVDAGFKGKLKTSLFSIWGQTSAKTAKFSVAPEVDLLRLPDQFIKIEPPVLATGALLDAWRSKQELPPEIVVQEIEGTRGLRIR